MDSRRTIDELLTKRDELDDLLRSRGIEFNNLDRIHQTYVKLEEYRDRVNANPSSGPEGSDIFLLLDVTELEGIIPFLSDLEGSLFLQKWNRLKAGLADRTTETASNNDARNTQFELMLYADLKRAGMNVKICEPNPDIEAVINGKVYSIQCKRVFNNNQRSVESALRNAAKQLREERKHHPNRYGIIALQIDRTFTEGLKLFSAQDHAEATKIIGDEHKTFAFSNKRLLSNEDIIKSPRVAGALLYSSTVGPIFSTKLVTHMVQLDMTDTLEGISGRTFHNIAQKAFRPYLAAFKNRYRLTPPADK